MDLSYLVFPYFWFISLLVSAAMVRLSIFSARRLDVMDHPIGGRLHKKPIPLLGGAAMFFSLALVIGGHWLITQHGRPFLPGFAKRFMLIPAGHAWRDMLAIGGGAAAMMLLGILDDIRRVSVRSRLIAQTAIAFVTVMAGVRPVLRPLPEALVIVVTIVWIVGITNAFNLVDGLDGLAGALATVAATALFIFMLMTSQIMVAVLLTAIIGTLCGFLIWNWHPAQTYMGSGGSLMLGYLMATVPLVSAFMQRTSNSIAVVLLPILVLSVPIYDTMSVILLRLGHDRSPFRSDHNHLAHRLRRLGLTVPQTVGAMALLGLATGLISLLLESARIDQAILILLSEGAMFAVFILLERVHLAHHDAERVVDLPARCWINASYSNDHPAEHHDARARTLSAGNIEMALPTTELRVFADAMAAGRTVNVQLEHEDCPTPLLLLCSIRSVWHGRHGTTYVGLAPMYADENSRGNAGKWIARATYPRREESEHE